MDALKKMLLLAGATLLALTLVAGPVVAQEDADVGEEAPVEGEEAPVEGEEAPVEGEEAPVEGEDEGIVGDHGDAEGGKIQLAETPRDQVGLILLAALLVGGGLAFANARRQLKGERPTATGEFRWR
jgi:hypothetical protein